MGRRRATATSRPPALTSLGLACVLIACNSDPDVVARTVTDVAARDGGVVAGGDAAAFPTDAAADVQAVGMDASGPSLIVGMPDASCDFSDALSNAGLGAELLLVAVTCTVPLWWFTQGVSGIDQREILRILLGETAIPPTGEGHEPDACGLLFGIFYYDDPANPANVILCPAVCKALYDRVVAGSGEIDCPGALPAPDASVP